MIRRGAHVRFRHLHRTVGQVVLAFVLIIAVTGVLLNHSVGMSLDQHAVPGWIAAWYYDDNEMSGFRVTDQHLYQLGSEIRLDAIPVTSCVDTLNGAVALGSQIAALCGSELLLVSPQGELIERLGSIHGVPEGVQRLGSSDGDLILELDGMTQRFALDSLSLEIVAGDVIWQMSVPVPAALVEGMLAGTVTWEKFILDIHSGRIVGDVGPWLADLVALMLVFMALSGLILSRPPRPGAATRSED